VTDFDQLDALIDALAEAQGGRQQPAARLAQALGCEELLLFVLDPEIRALVPAPGMPKTLRGGPRWRSFLKACTSAGTREAEVDLPEDSPRLARAISTGTFLAVALGGSVETSGMLWLQRRARVLGALLLSEQARRQQEATVELAREGAARAHSLATALDAARSAAAELNAKLRDESDRKDEFLAMLAHELRNPLAPLVNSVELLRRAAPEHPVLRRPLEVMARQLSHVARLVNDLLDVSRVSRRAIRLQREVLPLHEVLQTACETVAPIVAAKRHRLVVHDAPQPIYVDGDKTRLIQVFANLLSNAAKYTESGGLITIDVIADGGRASVVVKDNGIGIPPAMLGSIFELFSQVHSTLHRSEGGLGIGLTLARSLVDLHGGHVTAHSAGLGRGSTFVVTLPAARGPTATTGPALIPDVLTDESRRVPVMVVEDHMDGAAMMEELLRHMNADVCVARNGNEALTMLEHFTPELVLLDIGLPGMSGYEVASCLRSRLGSNVLLVALTGYGSPDDQARARLAGFDEHLVKPASVEALQRLINSQRVPNA
jgi:signal transduction histidine kinase/ActR/RegA family two-component response regulator